MTKRLNFYSSRLFLSFFVLLVAMTLTDTILAAEVDCSCTGFASETVQRGLQGDPSYDDDQTIFDCFKHCPDCPEMVIVEPPDPQLEAFAISRFEITRREWAACVRDSRSSCRLPDGSKSSSTGQMTNFWFFFVEGKGRPIARVNWLDAIDYTNWLSGRTDRLYHLPTLAQWNAAAVDVGSMTRKRTPDGQIERKWSIRGGATCQDCGAWTNPSQPAFVGDWAETRGNIKIHDMVGNVAEWLMLCDGPRGCTLKSKSAWTAGGSWKDNAPVDYGDGFSPEEVTLRSVDVGFRVATSVPDAYCHLPKNESWLNRL